MTNVKFQFAKLVKITSDGTPQGTTVTTDDGEPILCTNIKVEIDIDSPVAKAVLTVPASLDYTGPGVRLLTQEEVKSMEDKPVENQEESAGAEEAPADESSQGQEEAPAEDAEAKN